MVIFQRKNVLNKTNKTMNKNILKTALFSALVVVGLASCSDDHFDIRTGTASEGNTLWQNIVSNNNTNDFADILSRTRVMRSETDRTGSISYAELLDQPQTFSVWAPIDNSYDAQYYKDLLTQRDELMASGSEDDVKKAWQLNYQVANQFALNHIARFNYESNMDQQKVRMLNSKVYYYNAGKSEFNGVGIHPELARLNSSNGTLHVLEGLSPFAYNIYDYLGSSPSFSKVWELLTDESVEKTTDDYDASIPGAPNEDGDMVYVDTVRYTTNAILDRCNAQIRNEDSLYIAIIPSDNAWEAAREKVRKLFRYGPEGGTASYSYEWQTQTGTWGKPQGLKFDADSLRDYNADLLLLQSSYFSCTQMTKVDLTDDEAIIKEATTADSLISTNKTVFYNSNYPGENPNFNGQEPYRASNGFIYAVDQYNIDPAYSWISKHDIRLSSGYEYNIAYTTEPNHRGEIVPLTSENTNPNVKITEKIEDDNYRRYRQQESTKGSDFYVDIRLTGVYSGKYKISAILLPEHIDSNEIEREEAVDEYGNPIIDEETGEPVMKEIIYPTYFQCKIIDDYGNESATTPVQEVSQDEVKSYVLFDSYEFNKCYVDLPNNAESFPRLRIMIDPMYQFAPYNCRSLNLSKIILEPVRE